MPPKLHLSVALFSMVLSIAFPESLWADEAAVPAGMVPVVLADQP